MTGNNFQIESAAVSDRGLSKKRPQNEDSFLELNRRGLFAVADGVGGAQAGDVASQMAMEILGEAFINLKQTGDVEDLMKLAIERANEAIFQMSHDLEQLSTMATTVVALHVAGNIATIGHVGDSRLYRLDTKGNLYRETQDHSMVEEEVRAGRMTAEQAQNHPSKNIISRALGAEQTVEVDLKTIMIEPNTVFLLCSDGITRHIDDFQLRELLLYDDTPANICQRMKEICYERGAEDNLTAVIAKVTDKIKEMTDDDLEASTVAAARAQTANQSFVAEETPTQPLVMPVVAKEISNETIRTDAPQVVEESRVYAAETTSSRKASHFLSAALFLIIGGLVGAGVYHLFLRNNQPSATESAPQLTQQSPNIEFSSFETLRRNVDTDPNAFINRSVNTTLDAESTYLLGRAYLLTGKFPEAKRAFEEARNKLASANTVNAKILANDIALGLSIVDEAAAQTKFQSLTNPFAANNAQTNINGNTR